MKHLYRVFSGTLIIGIMLAVFFMIQGCGGGGTTTPTPDPPTVASIQDLKGASWQDYVGLEVAVTGIFVTDPVPMIVNSIEDVIMNTGKLYEDYLLLSGDELAKIVPEDLGGAKITVTGTVVARDPKDEDDDKVEVMMKLYEFHERLHMFYPYHFPIEWVEFAIEDRYAVLFSGGINANSNYNRYWNDLKFMYSTLINECSFAAANITVLYANGVARDNDMPVDDSATQANLEAAFADLEEISGSTDTIFFFATNHGGGFYVDRANPHWYGGRRDTNGDEGAENISESAWGIDFDGDGSTDDFVAWDEELFSWGGDIYDDAFTAMFNENLMYDTLIVVLEQCFSAGLIPDMAQGQGDIIVMAAAGQYEPSWAMAPDYNFDEFSYLVTCALNGADHEGNAVNADTNGDSEVTMDEVFNYARANDTASETPEYEDSGDGVATSNALPSGADGALGATVSFD